MTQQAIEFNSKREGETMTKTPETFGAVLVRRIEDWLSSWIDFGGGPESLVVALFVLNTWVFRKFDATPYLVITASTKRSGKSSLLECCSFLSQNGELLVGPTASTLYRLLDLWRGDCTLCFDEAEKLSLQNASDMRDFLNAGYRDGMSLPRTMPGGEVKKFSTFGPKAFSLIGDVYDTLRDRSIVVTLKRGTPRRRYRQSEARGEALGIVRDIKALFGIDRNPQIAPITDIPVEWADWLSGRDEEIWTPLVSLAAALGLSKADRDRLMRASADLTSAKTAAARRYVDMSRSEDETIDRTYGERLLRDAVSVLGAGERNIGSADLVSRLREIPSAPWRTFRGEGLDQIACANLLRPFGLEPSKVRVGVTGKGARKASQVLQGYAAASLRAAVPAVKGEGV